MSRNICIDIDGTLTDPYFFIPYLNKLTGKKLSIDEYTSIDWNDTYGPEYQEIYNDFDKKYSHIYTEAKIVDNAKKVIDNLVENGDKIYFVTARCESIEEITKEWINSVGLDESKVYSLSGTAKKVEMAKELNCDYFIEDDPNNAKNLTNAGIKVILMNTNYNQNLESDYLKRVDSWEDVSKVLSV